MRCFCLLLLAVAFPLLADFKENPDGNTLWLEDGVDISGWWEGLKFAAHPEGGFTIAPGESYNSGRYVPADPAYPWFCGEIVGYSMLEGYRGFGFTGSGLTGGFGMIASPQTGIFAVKLTSDRPRPFLRFDLHGLIVHFKYLKQVQKPEYRIETKRIDDRLEIRVFLKEPAEDVMVRFYDAYCMVMLRMNGEDKLQLLPTDENNPVEWSAQIPYPEVKTKSDMLLKAVILGGEIKVPLWGKLEPEK
ncbi:MAG: hypothetical protein BWX73_02785 [Lentisphaerae bacterium ADurb.Bin082]|nr:MAG: hypothetical protein BWX73_02785 [Lentisphaerae bacterium ADurb.Bin082]